MYRTTGRFEALAAAGGEDEDGGWGEWHGWEWTEMLGAKASRIMASMRSNGWAMTSKLHVTSLTSLCPTGCSAKAGFMLISDFGSTFIGRQFRPETVCLPCDIELPFSALQLKSSPSG